MIRSTHSHFTLNWNCGIMRQHEERTYMMTANTGQTIDDILNESLGIHHKTNDTPPSAESALEVVRWLKGCCESAEKRLKNIIGSQDSAKPPPKPGRSWREWPTYRRLQDHIARQDFGEEFMLDFNKMLYAMSKRMTPFATGEIVGREFLDNPAIPLEDRVEMMRIVEHLPSNSTLQRSTDVV